MRTLHQAFTKIADVAEQGRKMANPNGMDNPEMRELCEKALQEIVRTGAAALRNAPTTFGVTVLDGTDFEDRR